MARNNFATSAQRLENRIAALETLTSGHTVDIAAINAALDVVENDDLPDITFNDATPSITLDGLNVSGTWSDSNADTSNLIKEIKLLLNDQDITEDGTLTASEFSETTGTWAYDLTHLPAHIDGDTLTVKIWDADDNTDTATATLSLPYVDKLRELAGHPSADTTLWSWTTAPNWRTYASGLLGVEPNTGYKGAATIGSTNIVAQFTASTASGTAGHYHFRESIFCPSGTTLTYDLTINAVSVANGSMTKTGGVLPVGRPDEWTLDLGIHEVADGETAVLTLSSDGATEVDYAVWQLSDSKFYATAPAAPASGTTVYVDGTSGDDANSGSEASPKQTIRGALSVVDDGTPGNLSKIYVKRNSVVQDYQFIIARSYLHVLPYGIGAYPVLDGQNTDPATSLGTPAGTAVNSLGLIELRDCKGCIIDSIGVIDSFGAGFSVRNTSNPVNAHDASAPKIQGQDNILRYCHSDGTRADGIFVAGQDHNSYNNGAPLDVLRTTVEGCTVIDACNAWPVKEEQTTGQAITTKNARGVVIRNCRAYDYYKEGIDLIQSHDCHVHDCEVGPRLSGSTYGNNRGAAMYVDGFATGCSNILVENNLFRGDASGMTLGAELGGANYDITFQNNEVRDCVSNTIGITGEPLTSSHTRIKFYNNTVIGASGQLQYLFTCTANGPLADIEIKGNIFARIGSGASLNLFNSNQGTAAFDIADNCWWNGTGTVTGTTQTNDQSATLDDPAFETKAFDHFPYSTDYYIGSSSPALDKAAKYVKRDLHKAVRESTANDAGCYERV